MKMTHIKLAVLVTSLALTPLFATLAQAKQPVPPTNPVNLSGEFTYFTYAQKTQTTLQDAVFPTTATLTLLPDHQITLLLIEDHSADNQGLRISFLVGTMTPGGAVKMTYDFGGMFDLEAYLKAHLGCTVSGNFPIYYGTFDGKTLRVATEFNSQCKEYWPANEIFATPVDGPLHQAWVMDLTVIE